MSELSKANPFKTVTNSARGSVVVSRQPGMVTRGRSGGWMLKPKVSMVQTNDKGERLARTVVGGGLTQGGKTLVVATGAGGAAVGAHLHGKRYARRNKTRTVKVKIKKGALVPEVSESAFGTVSKATKPKKDDGHEVELRTRIRPATKKERRNVRIANGVTGGALGAFGGSVAGNQHSAKGALIGAGLGAAVGSGLGAAIPPPRHRVEQRLELRKSAFGVEDPEIAKAFPGGALGQSAMKAAKPKVAGMRNQATKTLKPLGASAMGGASAFGAKAKKGFNSLSNNQKLGAAAGAGAIGGVGVGAGMNRRKF